MIRNIAIIPARSGSKGVKDKNIRELLGKPLLAYSIEAAEKSGCFDNIFVSTDDERYALIAEKYGADASFLRSEETSSDTADSWSVVREVIDRLKIQGKRYDNSLNANEKIVGNMIISCCCNRRLHYERSRISLVVLI